MAAEQHMPPEEDEQTDSPLAKLLDEADAKMAAGGDEMAEGAAEMGAGAEMMDEGAMEQEAGEVEGDMDMGPLMETLGATEERAQTLYAAAQQIPNLAGKTPQELSEMIATDFDILMQLEMGAARGQGGAMGGPPAEEMPPAAPEGMPPGEMMPPEGM